jgi:predicted RNase H-like HicB family nuclease/DNA-binding XRE family transcriptional regulator
MKYHFNVHKEGKVFWAKCIELEGCYTQADSLNELNKMMKEALNLYISEPEGSMDVADLPDDSIKTSKNVVEVAVDAEVAFAFLMRYHRIKHGMTQSQVARKMGFVNVNGYQRLERKKCNPNLKTLSKIKQIFPDFSLDFAMA